MSDKAGSSKDGDGPTVPKQPKIDGAKPAIPKPPSSHTILVNKKQVSIYICLLFYFRL